MNIMKRHAKGEFKQAWGVEQTSGGSICTNSPTFIPIPQMRIDFELRRPQEITFEGKAIEESDGRGVVRIEIGLRIDGIDFQGSSAYRGDAQTEITHSVDKKIHLKKGLHSAEMVFRAVGRETGSVFLLPSWPAYLEAWY